jgi:predicted solute-binding protein
LNPYAAFDLKNYYTECISYNLTDKKREGLSEFLKRIINIKEVALSDH